MLDFFFGEEGAKGEVRTQAVRVKNKNLYNKAKASITIAIKAASAHVFECQLWARP